MELLDYLSAVNSYLFYLKFLLVGKITKEPFPSFFNFLSSKGRFFEAISLLTQTGLKLHLSDFQFDLPTSECDIAVISWMTFIGSGDEKGVIILCVEEETFGIVSGDEDQFRAEVDLRKCAYDLASFELESEEDVVFF